MTLTGEVPAGQPEYVIDYGTDDTPAQEIRAIATEDEVTRQRPVGPKSRADRLAEISLTGKDYFTVPEAAHYCCVSIRQLQTHAQEYGIYSRTMMGKVVYRKSDIQRAMEILWQPLTK